MALIVVGIMAGIVGAILGGMAVALCAMAGISEQECECSALQESRAYWQGQATKWRHIADTELHRADRYQAMYEEALGVIEATEMADAVVEMLGGEP